MAFTLEQARNDVLLQAKAVEVTLYSQTFKIAPTPPGDGLQAFMSVVSRREELMEEYEILKPLPKLKSEDEINGVTQEEYDYFKNESDKNFKEYIDALKENFNKDCEDIAVALFYSACRIDPDFTYPDGLKAISLLIDSTTMVHAYTKLCDVNRAKVEDDPNATTPTNTSGEIENQSTQASTETN